MNIRKSSGSAGDRSGIAPRRWWLSMLLLSLLLCLVWYSVVFTDNVRLDSERMLYEKSVAVSQYRSEGRFGLAFLLETFVPGEWNPSLSGILFLLFFAASAWVLVISLWRETDGAWPAYCYALFFLLYGTSPVWAFQVYFTLQSASVALGILLAVCTARMDIRLKTERRPSIPRLIIWEIAACIILVFIMSVYQSLIVCYAAAAVMLLFCRLVRGGSVSWKTIVLWVLRVVCALLLYILLARAIRGGESAYMMGHIRWRTDPVSTCLENILLEFGKTVVMVHSGHFSLYPLCLVLLAVLLVRKNKKPEKPLAGPALLVLSGFGLLLLPLAISIMQGSRPVPRTQFALQFVSAFLPVCFMGETEKSRRWLSALCAVAVILQSVLIVRLAYTDNQRNQHDLEAAAKISEDVDSLNVSGKPLQFVGTLPFQEDSLLMEKTDVFGLSFFDWSSYETSPTSAGMGAVRLLEAVTGRQYALVRNAAFAAEGYSLSAGMPVYPEDGYILETENYILIRLSE